PQGCAPPAAATPAGGAGLDRACDPRTRRPILRALRLHSVAIVGRPNVGKSSLLNRIARRRVSIVEPTAGVTRDRVAVTVSHGGRVFELVDTGGIGLVDETLLKEQVEEQIDKALEHAEVLVFVVDAKEGVTPGDHEAAARVRRFGKPIVLVAN